MDRLRHPAPGLADLIFQLHQLGRKPLEFARRKGQRLLLKVSLLREHVLQQQLHLLVFGADRRQDLRHAQLIQILNLLLTGKLHKGRDVIGRQLSAVLRDELLQHFRFQNRDPFRPKSLVPQPPAHDATGAKYSWSAEVALG